MNCSCRFSFIFARWSACLGNFDCRALHLDLPARNGISRTRDTGVKMALLAQKASLRDCKRNKSPANSGAICVSSGTVCEKLTAWWSWKDSNCVPATQSFQNGLCYPGPQIELVSATNFPAVEPNR